MAKAEEFRKARLRDLEQSLSGYLMAASFAGYVLRDIKGERLYREKNFDTFEDYCRAEYRHPNLLAALVREVEDFITSIPFPDVPAPAGASEGVKAHTGSALDEGRPVGETMTEPDETAASITCGAWRLDPAEEGALMGLAFDVWFLPAGPGLQSYRALCSADALGFFAEFLRWLRRSPGALEGFVVDDFLCAADAAVAPVESNEA
jgi:hypothetical protein